MKTEEKNPLIGVTELCQILNVGRNTAYKLLENKEIRAFKIGKTWKIPLVNIDELILKYTNTTNTKLSP